MEKYLINPGQKLSTISKDIYGHFSEHLGRCIYDGLYVGEDSPIPNVNGMRTDLVEALRDMGILEEICSARKKGITVSELSQKLGISLYGVGVLIEMGLGMGAIKLHKDSKEDDLRLTLGKIGFFLMSDEMTQVNMDFSEDICYLGAENLQESIRDGKPAGLKHLGNWKTVYQGLSQLTDQQKKSWFGFDHFYSDLAFPEALPIVFSNPCKRLFDIGGNTAKWAIACCKYDADVNVSIIDLPGQTAVAEKNAKAAGFENRIDTIPCNVLDETTEFPKGANAVWMSQFLDCFSLEEITKILKKIRTAAAPDTDVYVLEPLWDKQRFEAAAYSLQATSHDLYRTSRILYSDRGTTAPRRKVRTHAYAQASEPAVEDGCLRERGHKQGYRALQGDLRIAVRRNHPAVQDFAGPPRYRERVARAFQPFRIQRVDCERDHPREEYRRIFRRILGTRSLP